MQLSPTINGSAIGTSANHSEHTKVFLAFCDVTRLKVLDLLREGEKSATALQELIGARQSTLSHHMKVLMESGIISARKLGKWTYYSICESGGEYASKLLKLLTSQETAEAVVGEQPSVITEKRSGKTMSQFTIITDSSCDLPQEYLAKHNIKVLPIPLTIDDAEYNLTSLKEFYDTLRAGGVAKTSLINSEAFIEAFTEYAAAKKDALYICLSSGLSGTYQAARLALDEVKETYADCNLFPVDSISATAVQSLLVLQAVKKREEGLTAQETAVYLEEQKHKTMGIVTVDDLMYLYRGGRLSKLSALGGSLLSIKPIIVIQPDGTLALKEKARGRQAAFKNLVNRLKRSVAPGKTLDTVLIPHTDCEADAQKLAEMVKEAVSVREVIVSMMSPVIGAHVGPGALALVFEADVTREESESK